MIKYSYCFLFLFLMLSCTKTNDYYTDENSSSETVDLQNIKGIKMSISAIKTKNRLTISTYVTLRDEKTILDDIDIKLNTIEKPLSEEKSCYMMTNNIKTISFNKFEEIKDEINNSQMKFILYYEIEDPKIDDLDDLGFTAHIKSNYGTFNKRVIMEKHSRYRLFPEGA